MDAILFAAGLGTRLRPLTDHTPKALVEVGGIPIAERVARRLVQAGADRLIVNVHHFAEQVVEHLGRRTDLGVEVVFSHEVERPLETGGGLLHAAPHFRGEAPFFVHNADILTDLPLRAMYDSHPPEALATVAMMDRETGRRLIFDAHGLLGRVDEGKGVEIRVRAPVGEVEELAFAGVHVVSPKIFSLMEEEGAFSILDPYLRLAAAGERIVPFRVDGSLWLDIGRPEQLRIARERVDEMRSGG